MGAISEFYANTGNTSWNIGSEKDLRWNCSGRGGENAVKAKLKELGKKYGKRPKDLYFSAFKD